MHADRGGRASSGNHVPRAIFFEGEAPDRDFFIRQAHQFGFDVDDYLAALALVPVFSRDKVDYILEYETTEN